MRVGTEPGEALEQSVRHLVQRPQCTVTRFAMENVAGDAINVQLAQLAHSEGTQFRR